MLEKQPDGPKSDPGPLLTNGYANLFEMIDVNGVPRLVRAFWDGGFGGWDVYAYDASHSFQWSDEHQLSPAILVNPRPLSPFDPWTLCPFDPRIFFGSGEGFFCYDTITTKAMNYAERLRFFRHAFGETFCRNHVGYACHECAEWITLTQHTRIGICGWRTYDVPNTIQLRE